MTHLAVGRALQESYVQSSDKKLLFFVIKFGFKSYSISMREGDDLKAKKRNRVLFLQGTLCGVALTLLLLLLAGFFLLNTGVEVVLDSEDIADAVGSQVTYYARRDLPRMIDTAKLGIPEIVRNEMEGQLTSTRMEIAGFIFTLPGELVQQLEGFMMQNVENSVYQLLDGIDTSQLSTGIGETAALIVQNEMKESLHGQQFHIRVLGPFELPVTVYIRQ